MISEFGGVPTVRDHGLLESAVLTPAARFGGRFLHDGIPEVTPSRAAQVIVQAEGG